MFDRGTDELIETGIFTPYSLNPTFVNVGFLKNAGVPRDSRLNRKGKKEGRLGGDTGMIDRGKEGESRDRVRAMLSTREFSQVVALIMNSILVLPDPSRREFSIEIVLRSRVTERLSTQL